MDILVQSASHNEPLNFEVTENHVPTFETPSLPLIANLIFTCTRLSGTQERTKIFKYITLVLTFVTYVSFHLSRKVVGIVTPVLTNGSQNGELPWGPFGQDKEDSEIAALDASFLFAYAFGMFFSGHLAERTDLRYFLSTGMLLRLKHFF